MLALRHALAAAILAVTAATAQVLTDQQAASGQTKITDQGNSITATAAPHFFAARRAAGDRFVGQLYLCNQARPAADKWSLPDFAVWRGRGGLPGAQPPATRAFDNLYYLGVPTVTAWAIATPNGIILIDSLNNEQEVRDTIEPGLRRFGLDPAMIRYVIVTHGHGDHFGGAAYLARRYHARVLMSEADWALAPTMLDKPYFDPPPPRDMVIRDGDALTLGGETVRMVLTPGHTLGTVSLIFPVTWHLRRHMAALWGGSGFNFPHTTERFATYARSAASFAKLAAAAGVDVPLSNHPEIDSVIAKVNRLRPSATANPFVVGRDGVRRFFAAFQECALAYRGQLEGR